MKIFHSTTSSVLGNPIIFFIYIFIIIMIVDNKLEKVVYLEEIDGSITYNAEIY